MTPYREVLDSDRQLFGFELRLTRDRTNEFLAAVALYRPLEAAGKLRINYSQLKGSALNIDIIKLRWLRARVVSVKDKSWLKTVAGGVQGDEQPRTADEVSKL